MTKSEVARGNTWKISTTRVLFRPVTRATHHCPKFMVKYHNLWLIKPDITSTIPLLRPVNSHRPRPHQCNSDKIPDSIDQAIANVDTSVGNLSPELKHLTKSCGKC